MSALVFGGTGAVGSAVLRGLFAANVPAVFTYHRSHDKARALATEYRQRAIALDLGEPSSIRGFVRELGDEIPRVVIYCAATSRSLSLAEITDDDWRLVHNVNCHSAFVACQELAPRMAKGASIVVVGAIDRAQSLPAPIHFAASQGMLAAMVMALAKELAPRGVAINMIALGLLDQGLSREIAPARVADYKTFSALRRVGTPAEAARAILWLALENTYMNGEVVPVNGGL